MAQQERIESFQGEFRFLSNFWPAPVTLDDVIYPTVEHAYQAAKTLDKAMRERIKLAATPGTAKRLGRECVLRKNWNELKDTIMYHLVAQKFLHEDLQEKLLATGDKELIEGNPWGDTYWGVCRGQGKNKLGLILMKIRKNLG